MQDMGGFTLLEALAVATLAVALGYVVLLIVSARREARFRRERQRLALELMTQQVEAALARRRDVEAEAESWHGWRKFRIERKVREAEGICSFHLEPHDRKPLPPFEPGQHLTFQLRVPGEPKPIVRCYSLSDGPNPEQYRVSIKRVPAPRDKPDVPPGLVSGFFHDQLQEGDIVDAKSPGGHFTLDLSSDMPIVLIAGGVGITPLLSMLNTMAARGIHREVWFVYGVRNRGEQMMHEHLETLTREHDGLRLLVCFSDPEEGDLTHPESEREGHVSVDLLREVLPSSNYRFFICGPPPMMDAITSGLRDWGVPEEHISFEAFGAPTVRKTAPAAPDGPLLKVNFSRTGRECVWQQAMVSLLELARANGVSIDSGCEAGQCGTCVAAIRSGEVSYMVQPGADVDPGTCLTCVAIPKTDVVIDA